MISGGAALLLMLSSASATRFGSPHCKTLPRPPLGHGKEVPLSVAPVNSRQTISSTSSCYRSGRPLPLSLSAASPSTAFNAFLLWAEDADGLRDLGRFRPAKSPRPSAKAISSCAHSALCHTSFEAKAQVAALFVPQTAGGQNITLYGTTMLGEYQGQGTEIFVQQASLTLPQCPPSDDDEESGEADCEELKDEKPRWCERYVKYCDRDWADFVRRKCERSCCGAAK